MVTLFVKKQYTKKKNPNAKYAVKAEISMKTKPFNGSAKRSAFVYDFLENEHTMVLFWKCKYIQLSK